MQPMIVASKLIAPARIISQFSCPWLGIKTAKKVMLDKLHPSTFTKQGQAANRGIRTPMDQHQAFWAPPIRIEVHGWQFDPIGATDLRWFFSGLWGCSGGALGALELCSCKLYRGLRGYFRGGGRMDR